MVYPNVLSPAAGAKQAPGSRQVSPLHFWQVPPHPLSLRSLMTPDALLEMGFGVHKLRRKNPLPRCANPPWQPTSPHMTSNGRT